jgi:tetratricopeptide (TPR) repeat protein
MSAPKPKPQPKTTIPDPSPKAAPMPEADAGFFDLQTGPFFRRFDWAAFWTTLVVSFGVYFHTLAPTVTLEDSGELAVASDYLGVPHPPGYPIWTLLTWFFQWIFHWVRYYGQPDSNWMLVWRSLKDFFDGSYVGHPNPAWSVGLCSAAASALAAAMFSLLVSRSGSDIVRSMRKETELLGFRTESLFCWVCGVCGGLLFAFTPVLWSQSTIVEVYGLNAFFMVLCTLLTYRWMCRPHEDRILYITAFAFGLGLTNHQTLLFLGPAVMAAIWFRDRALFRDCMAGLFLLIAAILFKKSFEVPEGASPETLKSKQTMITTGLLLLAAPAGLFLIERKIMTEWKRFAIAAAMAFLGVSFYFGYLPVASEQNPPMNWGYPRTVEGFWHAVSRGQYEKISPMDNVRDAIKNPGTYPNLVYKIIFEPDEFTSVVAQFTVPLCLPALIVIFFLRRISKRARDWLIVTAIMFVFLTFVFIIFQYPKPDVQTLFIGRVQYIQAHAIFALWIAYGLIFGLVFLDTKLKGLPAVKYAGCGLALLLPLVPILYNAYNAKYIKIVGGAEQNGHGFGWEFGAWELEGAHAILAEIGDEERKAYPNPDYPPRMETNAIFFGGTDPGRFVPTYMIYSAHYREDVYLITQNALADNTYMNVMRDLYGDRIWIPSQQDSNRAFQQYVEDVREGRIPAGADVSFEGGRVSVQGVQGVMMINGILARYIFDKNKAKHAFYVEESYVIPWMYPYLTPHGLIMKINSEPVNLTPENVKNDHDFWDWYTHRLMSNPKFLRDVVARKTFSKLRSAIAGLYVARRNFGEAEYAFQQAITMYPLSPEANFRLADVYMQQFQFSKARMVIEAFLKEDPENDKVVDFLNQIKDTEKADSRRRELEEILSKGGDVNNALELAEIYRRMGLQQLFDGLCNNIVNQGNLPPTIILQVAQMYADSKRFDMLAAMLEKYLQREPANVKVWIDLAAVYANTQKNPEAIRAVRKAIDLGGNSARDLIRGDARFNPLRGVPEFNTLVPPAQPNLELPVNLPLPGM